MSAMGEFNFFLGLQVLQKEDGIFISQEKYVGDILKKFGYLDVRSLNTPMEKENPWGKDGTGKDVDLHLYRSMIGSLMYLTASRPDIMFAVCAYARHQTLVDCPKGVKPVGTKWVLKKKKNERGIIVKNKAMLVAQGHTQEEGIDYDEVFAPVARIEAIILFLAYASFMGFTVYQMDVKSAFLYGTIDEEVYVMQPPRFQDPTYLAKVYKVKKAMYELHQAPRA
nr:putative ribonuclease H-like domain-containing protein [Tanacetum cinerariifolium]